MLLQGKQASGLEKKAEGVLVFPFLPDVSSTVAAEAQQPALWASLRPAKMERS